MQIHYGGNEYTHLVGRQLLNKTTGITYTIQNIIEHHNSIYCRTTELGTSAGVSYGEGVSSHNNMLTDIHAGNAYCIYIGTIDNTETFHFRHFAEVVKKYGDLVALSGRRIPHKSVKRFPQVVPTNKWSKVHPET